MTARSPRWSKIKAISNASKLGVTVTDQDIDNYITQLQLLSDAPLITATPTATLIPEKGLAS